MTETRKAPASCPHCFDESDCSQIDICNAVNEVYPPNDELAWLIEHGDSATSEPRYWAAGQTDANRSSAWTFNHMEAIRFARKVDAEKVVRRIMKGVPVRIAEHGWPAVSNGDQT
jgi:hypothetical protein